MTFMLARRMETWIYRRSADFAVEGLQFVAKTSQYPGYDRIDPA
jgi:hypothetical protein